MEKVNPNRCAALDHACFAHRYWKEHDVGPRSKCNGHVLKSCLNFGNKQSIIFIRDRNAHGQEVSAYIDYAHRLITDFEVCFSGKKRPLPRNTDLSFYNWDTNVSTSNSSPNFQVIAEDACGLLFKNKSDRKIINVDPKAYPGDNTTRTPVETDLFLHVVIYDHVVGRGT
ncbi:PREDICTED: uncharacterized protein C4orf22 homolog [Buceros rhinoceros silvestris]|uniref:uncharacterized protein C4orf22 homolog n=1 Tax=Buceros rhinoceros silvestris TaxID=175836 RepID=UPI000528A2F0|nr:PREDICTED: uncharacterized protein C4orf22 homolog [Buceros rhinoceros silvestris]